MRKGEHTRQDIIRKAAPIFNQKGYDGAALSDLMRATGLEKGGIYRHFESKEEAEAPVARLISIPFLLLRVSTAGGAFAMGLVQTLVFARVLTPDRFSLFILVGAIGYSLWLCDLGLAKILFVQLRTAHLAGKTDARAASQATAVIVFYVLLAAGGSLICFGFMAARPSFSLLEAADFGLFFFYITLNLTWVCLRSLSIAVDEYVFYEKL